MRATKLWCVSLLAFVLAGTLSCTSVRPKTLEMNWTTNHQAPWGDVEGPSSNKAEKLVVVYERVRGGYCYDAIYSNEIAAHLEKDNKAIVPVTYDEIYRFGRSSGYTLRAINGASIGNGPGEVRNTNGFGGEVEIPGEKASECNR